MGNYQLPESETIYQMAMTQSAKMLRALLETKERSDGTP